MFIIFGSPRSGTTLLREMLNQHSDILIPEETSFIVPCAYILDRVADPNAGRRMIFDMIVNAKDFTVTLAAYLSREDIWRAVSGADYTLLGVLSAIYTELGKKTGKRITADKSPNDLLSVQILQNLGLFQGDVKILHIVRDIRAVVLSLLKVDWAPADIGNTFPRTWSATNVHLSTVMSGSSSYHLLRYEDLVGQPDHELKKICAFLNVDYQESMLSETRRGLGLRHLPHHMNLGLPVLQERAAAWRHEVAPELEKSCMASALEGLRLFGYEE